MYLYVLQKFVAKDNITYTSQNHQIKGENAIKL